MTTETTEERVKGMGWVPKEEFRGDAAKWIEAEEYVKRGETMLPLVQAANRRLTADLSSTRQEVTALRGQVAESQDALKALVEFNSEANRKAMKAQIASTKGKLIEAKKADDAEAEVELEGQLRDEQDALRTAEVEGKAAEGKGKVPAGKKEGNGEDFTSTQDWKAWAADNTWFGQDKRRTALAMGIADELRSDPQHKAIVGRAFLDKVTEEVEKTFNPGKAPTQKVEGGGPRSGESGINTGKSFSDLPAEAKEACERQAARLVGPNRAYKTTADWRAAYTNTYFSEE